MERWKSLAGAKKVTVLPLWHGSGEGKIRSICHHGFDILGRDSTDPGYFGKGIYFTTSAKYAVNAYSKDGHLLLAWVSMREPYPVVLEDLQRQTLLGKIAHDNHDAHYIPVISASRDDPFEKVYEPTGSGQDPMCDEVVVFKEAQTLAAFWIELQPDLPYSPSPIPPAVKSLLQFVINVFRQKSSINGHTIRELLKELATTPFPSEEDSAHLLQQYGKIAPFFSEKPNTDFIEYCQKALQNWKSVFDAQDHFTALPTILELLLPKRDQLFKNGWDKGCELLLPFLERSATQAPLSPFTLFKDFIQHRPQTSLVEFAIQIASSSKSREQVDQYLPLIEGAVEHLKAKNSSTEQHEKLYTLLSSKAILEPLRERYLRLMNGTNLFNKLASIPNKSGFRQKMRIEQENLIQQIEAITQDLPETAVKVTAPFLKETRYLKETFIDEKIDKSTGGIKTDERYQKNLSTGEEGSSHPVCQIEGVGFNLHLKEKPTQPMQEYGVYSLTNRIAGEGVPPSHLVRFDVNFSGRPTASYPVLISKTIKGDNLKKFLNENPNETFSGVSQTPIKKLLTHLQLLGVLTRPGDGRASNFIINEEGIYSVDNDVSFVDPLVQEWPYPVEPTLYFKSILYCLNTSPLDSGVLEEWKGLFPEQIFADWIEDLAEREKLYTSLFTEKEAENLKFIPNLLLREGTIATLLTQFHQLQYILKKQPPQNGLDLLNHIITLKGSPQDTSYLGPRIYKRYNIAYEAKLKPTDRLQKAIDQGKDRSLTSKKALESGLGKIPTQKEIKGLYSLEKLRMEFAAYTLENEEGILTTQTDGKQAISCDFSTITLDGKPDLERQRAMLRGQQARIILRDKRPEAVTLIGCAVLTTNDLLPFLHKDLVSLHIAGCHNLSSFALPGNFNLGNTPLELPLLERLTINGCDNLLELRLNAPQLEELTARKNPRLTTVWLVANFKTLAQIDGSPLDLKQIIRAWFPLLISKIVYQTGTFQEILRSIRGVCSPILIKDSKRQDNSATT